MVKNEYEILLSYLDKETKKSKEPKESLLKIQNLTDVEPKKFLETTKILEEYKEERGEVKSKEIISNQSLGFETEKFENLMRSRLIDDYKKLQSYERPYISVTELFYCIRKAYYNRLKYQTNLKQQFNFAYLDLINRVANVIHEYVQEIYNFTEVEKSVVSEKYKVKGRIDAISDAFLYELKTIEEKKFDGIYSKEHYYQGIIYSYILNSEYNYNIKTITIVYFFRDNLKKRPVAFDLPLDNKVAIHFLENAHILHNCILRVEVPNPINTSQEQCKWCPYISFCEKDESILERPFMKNKRKVEYNDLFSSEQINKKESIFLI